MNYFEIFENEDFDCMSNRPLYEKFVNECLTKEEVTEFLEKNPVVDYFNLNLELSVFYKDKYFEFCENLGF